MSKHDQDIFKSLLTGGIIGAALGAILTKDQKNGSILGALAGAAILASLNANKRAAETNIPLILEEDNCLYEVHPDGSKKFIKKLEDSGKKLPKKFNLD